MLAFDKIIKKRKNSSKGEYRVNGRDWDAFRADPIHYKIKESYHQDTMLESFHNWFKYPDMNYKVEIEEHVKRILLLLKHMDDLRGRTTGGPQNKKPTFNDAEKTHYLLQTFYKSWFRDFKNKRAYRITIELVAN